MAKKTKESSKSKSKSNAKHNGVQHDKTKKTASGKRKRDRTTATAAATGAGAGTADEARELKRKLQELRKVAGVHHRAAKSTNTAAHALLDRLAKLEAASTQLEVALTALRKPKSKPRKKPTSQPVGQDDNGVAPAVV
jgi:hypothetical protein